MQRAFKPGLNPVQGGGGKGLGFCIRSAAATAEKAHPIPQGSLDLARPGFSISATTGGCGLWQQLLRGCGKVALVTELRDGPFSLRPGAVPGGTPASVPWAGGKCRTHTGELVGEQLQLEPLGRPCPSSEGARSPRSEAGKGQASQ